MKISAGRNFKLDLQLQPNCKAMELIWIESGTFIMGYNRDPELRVGDDPFEVTLSQGFWLGKFEVTQAHWVSFMDGNPSNFKGENLPVENVSWDDACQFCAKLNELYRGVLPENYQFNLPTEVQWEYAARAGTTSRNYGGDSLEDTLRIAWCSENSNRKTQDVGLKESNAWGLYDLFGNVSEWCFDTITDYPKQSEVDWIGTVSSSCRVVRGSSYGTPAKSEFFNSAARDYTGPDTRRAWYGFRLCLRVMTP
jgi:formylglycine-generating enzyme required for sulfatase activity